MSVLAACVGGTAPATQQAFTLDRCDLPPDSVRHLIVLDRSGSMRPAWPVVRRQIAAIAEAVPDGSWLQVAGFSDRVVTLVQDVRLTAESRSTVVQQAMRLPEPQPLASTDLGLAMESALDDLFRARERGRGRVSLVFLITDGRHDPPQHSRYADAELFPRLRDQWQKRLSEPATHPFIFAVPVGEGLEGAELVQATIPGAVVLPLGEPDHLAETVNDIIRRSGREVQRALVTRDRESTGLLLQAHVVGEPRLGRFGSTRVPVVLRSSAACVTYELSGLRLAASLDEPDAASRDAGLTGSIASAVLVGPGDSARVEAALRGDHPRGHWLPTGPDLVQALGPEDHARLAGVVRLEPRDSIEALLVDARPAAARIPLTGTFRLAPIGWFPFAALLALPLVALLLAGYAALPPRPGLFRATPALNPGGAVLRTDRLARVEGGRRILHDDARGATLWVRYHRASRLRSPKRVRVIVETNRPGVIGVAEPRPGGAGHAVTMLSHDAPARELTRRAYVVWAANGEPLPGELPPGQVDLLPGYYWSGRA